MREARRRAWLGVWMLPERLKDQTRGLASKLYQEWWTRSSKEKVEAVPVDQQWKGLDKSRDNRQSKEYKAEIGAGARPRRATKSRQVRRWGPGARHLARTVHTHA